MIKSKILLLIGLSVLITNIPLNASEMCCDMEAEMEYCWAIQDIEGFNAILEDWWEFC